MDRDHRNNRKNDLHHEGKRRHGSSASSGKSEQRKSSKVKEKEFVSFTNRFSREKLSRGAVIPGSGLKDFLENNRPFMRKSVWEKKITPRSNSQYDNQSPPRSMPDSRTNQHDLQDIRNNEPQRRGSLDRRIMDLESDRRISVGSAGVPETSHINNRHKRDDGYYTGDNREEVPMDIDDEEHVHTPVSDEGFNRRDRHHSSEINHNYAKDKYNLNLEPLPVIKSENIKLEIKHEQERMSPVRLPRFGTLENYTYERNVTPPRSNNEFRENFPRENSANRGRELERPNHEFSENFPRRSPNRSNNEFRDNSSRENLANRCRELERPNREFSENVPRRSPKRSRESETVQNSEDNCIPMPPEKVVVNMNEAIPMSWHCQIYLSGLKCHKGDYCDKIHKYPRENGVVCIDFMSGQCNRKADDCWFQHPGQVANEKEPDESAPVVVQSMGGLLKYIKKEVSVEPNKYKSKEKPKKISPKKGRSVNANMVPLGSRKVGNANMTPLGSRDEIDNYSPLQPRRSTASSISYDSNPSQQESSSLLKPRSKSSNNHLSNGPKSPLDRIDNSIPSSSAENILSNNTSEENEVESSTRDRDLSKTKYNFINNPPTTVNEVEDDGKRKHKKRKRDNSEEINTDNHISKEKKNKKSKSKDERNCESEGITVDPSGSHKSKEKNKEKKKKVDEKGLYKAIDKLLDKAATGGEKWKKSSDREGDIISLLEEFDIPIYIKGNKYKNLEINFRQLYLKFAKVDDGLKDHAFWFRESFPDFSNLPKDHHNDATKCCEL